MCFHILKSILKYRSKCHHLGASFQTPISHGPSCIDAISKLLICVTVSPALVRSRCTDNSVTSRSDLTGWGLRRRGKWSSWPTGHSELAVPSSSAGALMSPNLLQLSVGLQNSSRCQDRRDVAECMITVTSVPTLPNN